MEWLNYHTFKDKLLGYIYMELWKKCKCVKTESKYEISNFGKKDFFAVHNTNYWLQKNYMGIGPSAHSFNGFSRQWNLKNNLFYVKALKNNTDFFVLENLSLKNRYNEYVLTRLRTIWGCNEIEINQLFGLDILAHFKKVATEKKEFFEIKKKYL